MPARKSNEPESKVVPGRPSGEGKPPLASASDPKSPKGRSSTLNKDERALLKAIDDAPEPLRYDLIMKADKALVKSLIQKKEIRVRKIQRSPVQGTIPREAIREAILAVKRRRAQAKAGSTG